MDNILYSLAIRDHIDIKEFNLNDIKYEDTKYIFIKDGSVTVGNSPDNKTNEINFVGDEPKAVIELIYGFYGFVVGNLKSIINFYSNKNNLNTTLIILTHNKSSSDDFLIYEKFLLKYLDDINVSYKIMPILTNYNQYIKINNFTLLDQNKGFLAPSIVYPNIKKYIADNVSEKKKVFVSRKNASREQEAIEQRSMDHEKLEAIFKDIGFEIVYAENFENFIDQINYFSNVEVLAGLTGAGMTNMIFMNPGSKVIQLMNPVSFVHDKTNIIKELHFIYDEMAFFKDHKMLLIPNKFNPADLENDANTIQLIKDFVK